MNLSQINLSQNGAKTLINQVKKELEDQLHAPFSLKNKTVLNPRGKRSALLFSNIVEKYGGIPIEIPLIDFKPLELTSEFKEVMMKIQTYDWIIFTSNVTVETFFYFRCHVGCRGSSE